MKITGVVKVGSQAGKVKQVTGTHLHPLVE